MSDPGIHDEQLRQADEATLNDENAPLEQVREALKRSEKRRKAAEATAASADEVRRENAFLKAGVDVASPLGKLLFDGYKGEMDVDAIKAAYAAVAPTPPSTEQTVETPEAEPPANDAGTQGLSEEQLERLRAQRQGLQSESAPPGTEPATPYGRAIMDAAYERQGGVRARPAAGMNDAAMNAGFSKAFERANAGDPEAVFKRPDETWADATQRWRESQG